MIKLKLTKEEIFLVIIEVAKRKYENINRQLQEQLYKYSATGLFNRYYLIKKGTEFLKKGKFNAIAVIDVRDLHTYNEIFRYGTTDRILREVGLKIKEFCGNNCLIGNLDSGRFWLLLNLENKSEEKTKKVFGDLIRKLTSKELAIEINNETILVLLAVNIGVAFYPEHGNNITELLISAELATDHSKKKGINRVEIFVEKQKKEIEENIWIEENLRKAIRSGVIEEQIFPKFQLKVSPFSGDITGVEVLMRWKLHNNIFKVVTIAEKMGLIEYLFEVLVKKTLPVIKKNLAN